MFFALLSVAAGLSAAPKAFTLKSPDGRMKVEISTDGGIRYSLTHDGVLLLENSSLSMSLTDGTVYGGPESKLRRARTCSVDRIVKAVAYKKAEVRENYNEMTLEYRGFKVIFRAYDDACAYRFISLSDKPFIVKDERADFRFPEDRTAYIPYIHKNGKDRWMRFWRMTSSARTPTRSFPSGTSATASLRFWLSVLRERRS